MFGKILIVLVVVIATGCTRLDQKDLTSSDMNLEEKHLAALNKTTNEVCLTGQTFTHTRSSSLIVIAGGFDEEHWTSNIMCLSSYDGASLIRVTCEDTQCVTEDVRTESVSDDVEIIRYDFEEESI